METELARRSQESKGAVYAMQVAISSVVRQAAGSATAREVLHDLASRDQELFFDGAMALLDSLEFSSERTAVYQSLGECPEFLIQLTRIDRFSRSKLLELCSNFLKVDTRLDVHLADILPRRYEDKYGVPPATAARILDILNEISVGPRLVLLLSHLTKHPDPEVAEKAVVLTGRRISNTSWQQRHLTSNNEGVRAAALEAMWGKNTPAARNVMWGHARDSSHRVAGNALIGLHKLGETGVREIVTGMLDDARPPFRSTAVKVMGQTGDEHYTEPLVRATMDSDSGVRLEAKRALAAIRRPILRQQELAAQAALAAPPEPPQEAVVPPPEEPRQEDVGMDFRIRLDGRHTSLL
jgi:hypothetical protein